MGEEHGAAKSNASHVVRRRIPYSDADTAGVLYFPNYIKLYDIGTHELFRSLGLPLKQLEDKERVLLPVISLGAEYKSSVRFDDEVEILTKVEEVSRRSIKISHTISRDGVLMSQGWEVRVWTEYKDGIFEAKAIPDDVRAKLLNK